MTDERAPDLFVVDAATRLILHRPDLRDTFAHLLVIRAVVGALSWHWSEVRKALAELRDDYGLDIGPDVWRVVADEETRLGLGSALRGL